MRFDNYLKLLATVAITAILLMIWFSKGHAEVQGLYDDLNTDLWEDKGIIKVETGNETYDAIKIKLNNERILRS